MLGRWNHPWVRRSAAIAAAVLLVVAAAYTGFWLYAAKRIKAEFAVFAASARADKTDIAWQALDTGGYPFRFRIELTGLHINAAAAGIDATAPRLVASAQPWDFENWRFALPNGLDAAVAGGATAPPKLSVQSATGAVSVQPDGGSTIWLTLGKSKTDTPIGALGPIAFDQAITWLILPAQPPKAPTDPYLSFAAELRGVTVPAPPPPFSNTLDDLSLGLAVMGPVPGGPLADALAGWRQAGGTLKLEHSEIAWDQVDITGNGAVALDPNLQPNGSVAIQIAGYDQLLTALSLAGLVPESDVTPIKLGLAMIGPAISTFFTIKDGDMFLGPANLGKAPKIAWK